MKASEVYIEAARQIEAGDSRFSCSTIALVGGFYDKWDTAGHMPPILTRYIETFAENERDLQEKIEDWQGDQRDDPRDIRVLALCFMAAMAGPK